jgi:hypothetical protein
MKSIYSYTDWVYSKVNLPKLSHNKPNNAINHAPDVYELFLHITNDQEFYKKYINPIIQHSAEKARSGKHDTKNLISTFNSLAQKGIEDYGNKHGKFSVNQITVSILAENLLTHYISEIQDEIINIKDLNK